MAQLRDRLKDLFGALTGATGGIQLLDLQDFVAGSGCQPPENRMTPSDVVGWMSFLKSLGQIPHIEVNVEQYELMCNTGGIGPGDPDEIAARERFYVEQGLTLGAAFEIRYWMQVHGSDPSY